MKSFKELEKIYNDNLLNNKCYLEEQQWITLATSLNLSRKDFLFYTLDFAKNFSQSPLSHYKVGAVGVGKSNKLYLGTNIEFSNFPLNQSIHAEQALISLAYAQMEEELKEIYLTAFPCGHCRQFFREMGNYKEVKILSSQEKEKTFSLLDLLPHSFGPQDLNVTQALFVDKANLLVKKLIHVPKGISDKLQEKILFAIRQSFSPYSHNPSGIVFEFNDSDLVLGSYIESCAHNPSLSPFHMAYAQVVLSKRDIKKLKSVYLVEMENTQVIQENIIRSLLQKYAPQVKIFIIKASAK